tara:strand:+ start:3507 stop:3950 length:444 start_codon:yes stop_codon:yes gene_type:complete
MLKEKIKPMLKEAMKAKESLKLTALRSIISSITNKEKETGKDSLTEAEEIQVLSKIEKEHLQSISDFEKGNREDLVADEKSKLQIIQSFLPQKMSEEDITKEINDIISEGGFSGMRDMGKVMKTFNEKHAGKADGKLVANLVKQSLN